MGGTGVGVGVGVGTPGSKVGVGVGGNGVGVGVGVGCPGIRVGVGVGGNGVAVGAGEVGVGGAVMMFRCLLWPGATSDLQSAIPSSLSSKSSPL